MKNKYLPLSKNYIMLKWNKPKKTIWNPKVSSEVRQIKNKSLSWLNI